MVHVMWCKGGYSSLVLVGMCHSRIWKYTHTNTNFSRKSDPFIYQSTQFLEKFWAKSNNFSKIFLNILAQIWKILKNQPIYIPNFAFYKGSFIYQEVDFATHVGGIFHSLLYWVPPPHCAYTTSCTVASQLVAWAK